MRNFLQRSRGWIGSVLVLLVFFLSIVFCFQQRWLLIFQMKDTQAMWPTIQPDDLVLAETVSRRFLKPRPGQLIIFKSSGIKGLEETHGQDPPWLYVQRLVALPGDSVRIADGEMLVNDIAWQPAEWDGQVEPGAFLARSQIKRVPSEAYFVMADHYSVAEDSRHWGWVPGENLKARVLWVFRAEN